MNSIWIARDKDGSLWAFPSKPERDILSYAWITIDDMYSCRIPNDWFPDLKWDDNPIELITKERAIEALDNVLDNFVHGGDEDCIIAEFERELDKVE